MKHFALLCALALSWCACAASSGSGPVPRGGSGPETNPTNEGTITGVVAPANGGTGVANVGTLTVTTNANVTGGGTLALGGFTLTASATGITGNCSGTSANVTGVVAAANGGTGVNNGTNALTVPATGTAALLGTANTFTAAQTFNDAVNGTAIGTTAGKLVALDGSAKLPAVDGSALTGVSKTVLTINPQADNYTLLAADAVNTLIQMSKTSASALSMPTDATYNFAIGTTVNVIQTGAGGVVTIQAANSGTTTVVSTGGTPAAPVLRVIYSSATLIKVAANSWEVIGDIK